jgi:hypothetical protein
MHPNQSARLWPVLLSLANFLAACAPAAAATSTPSPTIPFTQTPIPVITATPSPAPERPTPTAAPGMEAPPPATLTINGQSQSAGIGSYCWNTSGDPAQGIGLCVDKMGLITPLAALAVPAGAWTAQFQLPLEQPPSEVSLNVYPATGQPSLFDDVQAWMPTDNPATHALPLEIAPAVDLNLAPGQYVFGLFVRWEGWGDVFYGFLVQVGEGQGAGAAFPLPASCVPATEAQSPYVDPGGRYCLQFPSYFRIGDVTMDRVNFYGPPLDQSIEPLFAALSLQVDGPAGGLALTEVVDLFVTANALGQPVTRREITLGGEPAEVVEGLPGRTLNWQAFVIHNDEVYHLSLYPKDPAFPQTEPDAQAVWLAVETTFTFLP